MRRLLACALLVLPLSAGASRPIPAHAFAEGLEAQEGPVSANGVLMLKVPPPSRIFIAGGTFEMGAGVLDAEAYARLCMGDPSGTCREEDVRVGLRMMMPAHRVTLSPFHIDRTEVTVAQYSRCVAAGQCGLSGVPANDKRFDRPELPVTYVTWDDAKTFCKFAKGRLPTEAEWELAARGEANRPFPWGKIYNPFLCNHGSASRDPADATDGYLGLAPAGALKDNATPLGVVDLSGNVAEWVEDLFEEIRLPNGELAPGYSAKPQTNPVITKGSGNFGVSNLVRGGAFDMPSYTMLAVYRIRTAPTVRRADVGIRCAYDAEGFSRLPTVNVPRLPTLKP